MVILYSLVIYRNKNRNPIVRGQLNRGKDLNYLLRKTTKMRIKKRRNQNGDNSMNNFYKLLGYLRK